MHGPRSFDVAVIGGGLVGALRSAQAWPRLAAALADATGIDVRLEQRGGLSVFLSERERETRIEQTTHMLAQPGMPRYVWRVIDGQPFSALRGDSVAAALLAHGRSAFRATPVSGAPRGPYCMMGVCFECLVTIDGRANRQACMVRVEEGMRIETITQRQP